MYQDIKYDFTAELTGTGDRPECDTNLLNATSKVLCSFQ